MKSHELAKLLLELPNLDVIIHANNHSYSTKNEKLVIAKTEVDNNNTEYIMIGNMWLRFGKFPHISEVYTKDKLSNGYGMGEKLYSGKTRFDDESGYFQDYQHTNRLKYNRTRYL